MIHHEGNKFILYSKKGDKVDEAEKHEKRVQMFKHMFKAGKRQGKKRAA